MVSTPIGTESKFFGFAKDIYAISNAKKNTDNTAMIWRNFLFEIFFQKRKAKDEYSKVVYTPK